ncbi:MAG TPA: hypothetical protein VNH18_28910 [Bryobacteraceae bacterium]|nr:hypothetical protein [Bryobacteraceae bacterium]
MLGWIIVFFLLSLTGVIPAALGTTQMVVPTITAGALFGFLFLVCVLARFVRQKA